MSKQKLLRVALVGACTLMIGLAGCNNNQPTSAPIPPGTPGKPPQSMVDQVNNLPPEQRQRALEQMQAAQNGKPAGGAAQTDSSGGKQ